MVVWLYGIFDEYSARSHPPAPNGPSFCLTAPYDLFSLGDVGKGLGEPKSTDKPPTTPLSAAAQWVQHGALPYFPWIDGGR
jgi:hypothetical protein